MMDYFRDLPFSLQFSLAFLVLWTIYGYGMRVIRARQINALGGFAGHRPSYVKDLDVVYLIFKAYAKNESLQFWYRIMKYAKRGNPWTVEVGVSTQRSILTADPENIKAILATQFNEFGKGERMHTLWYEFLGDGIFTTDGQQWHASRQLIRPQFIRDRLSNLHSFERHVSILTPQLAGDGRIVNLTNLLFRYTLDAATDFLFGRSVDSLVHEQAKFANAFEYVQHTYTRIQQANKVSWVIPRKKVRQELKVLDDFINAYVQDALQLSPEELEKTSKSDESYTFLHALAVHTRDHKVLRDQIMSVLLAGRDTTACTLSWLFYELSTHPQVFQKLRKEIVQQVGTNRTPTYADLKAMRYLQHAINETMRLYPVVPYNARSALTDTSLPSGGGPDGNGPIGVRKGTQIGYSTLVMQRREDLYPPPSKDFAPVLEFSPERWENWVPRSWQYVPFNGGPRICIGQQFALTEMAYTVTRVLQLFDKLEYHGNGHPGLKVDIVLSPAKPVLVSFTKAKN